MTESVLIVGVGSGLSASLARLCSKKNMIVNLAARNIDKLKALKEETNANTYQCDSTNKEAGIRPAINVGLSVSRVGSAAQTKD